MSTVGIRVTDPTGRFCIRDYTMDSGFDCQGAPSSISGMLWTISRSPNDPVNLAASFAGGSGSYYIKARAGSCLNTIDSIRFDSVFCNPTASPKTLTFTIPWDDSGNVCTYSPPVFPATIGYSIEIGGSFPGNGTIVSQVVDLIAGPTINPVVLVGTFPANSSLAVRLYVILKIAPDTVIGADVFSTSAMTLT